MGTAMMGTGESEGEGRAAKATELALNNPLIDDYSLKGAKGLLINITGGEDLTLFEVDEIVNKVRSEVDSAAEIINGSIIDPALEGKIRVSIVATALDGQKPESKSIINMVHRIQNRNPGYSDFSKLGTVQALNFSNENLIQSVDGANALKLENEVISDSDNNLSDTSLDNEEHSTFQDILNESDSEIQKEVEETKTPLNGLEHFEIEEETPDLFSNQDNDVEKDSFSSFSKDSSEEDELEIPAFLRKQKN